LNNFKTPRANGLGSSALTTITSTLYIYIVNNELSCFSCWVYGEFLRWFLSQLDKIRSFNCNIMVRNVSIFSFNEHKIEIANYVVSFKRYHDLTGDHKLQCFETLRFKKCFRLSYCQWKYIFYPDQIKIILKTYCVCRKKNKKIFCGLSTMLENRTVYHFLFYSYAKKPTAP